MLKSATSRHSYFKDARQTVILVVEVDTDNGSREAEVEINIDERG